jgi:6-phosphogluconolactonase/glucosamine-6-phosphate isomerase/deaminase
MATEMKIIDFEREDSFVNTIVGNILSDMRNCLDLNEDLRILLSGGSTPIPIYNKLDQDRIGG